MRCTIRGTRHWIGIGSLALVSLADARVDAVNLRSRARKGEDVLAIRRAEKLAEKHESGVPTFEAAALKVYEGLKPTFHSETHSYNWLQSLKTYFFPAFGKKRVNEIDSSDVLKALGPIWTTIPDTAG